MDALISKSQTFLSLNKLRITEISFFKDARHFQILAQATFLVYGILFLNWNEINTYLFLMISCLVVQAIGIAFTTKDYSGLKSAFISSLSLSLMFKSNHLEILALAAFLSIGSKYVFRYKGKHFFNPTNFGIIITILFTGEAWLSPGQWGNELVLVGLIIVGAISVLLKSKTLNSSLAFILVFGGLNFARQVLYLGWELDVFFHHMSSGTLLLFTFFMITDPKSSPNSPVARIIWASVIAILSFFLTSWFYVYSAPLWALFILSPFTILFDKWFMAKRFNWSKNE